MKKTFFKGAVLSLALCLCCLFGTRLLLPASAEETAPDPIGESLSEAAPNTAPEEGEEESEAKEGTLSAEIASLLKEHAPTVLSAASLLLLTAVTLFFKKGVLPKLLSLFESLFKKSGETLSSLSDYERAIEGRLSSLLAKGEEVFASAEGVKATEGALRTALLENQAYSKRLSTLFSEQSALLFELLMSANLPQYQKDRVAAVFSEAEKSLAALTADGVLPDPTPRGEG